MYKYILSSLALFSLGASTALSEITQENLYDYWDFNTNSNGTWKIPTHSSGGNPDIAIGNHVTSKWDPNYGYGYVSGQYDKSGNGSMFASFKEGGDITLKYSGNNRPTWKDSDGMSISMLICNGNIGAWNSSSHGFYCETNFGNSATGASENFYFAFVPESDQQNMRFQTNMPGVWSNVNVSMPLPNQDKLLSLVVTLAEGQLSMYLDGTLLLTCDQSTIPNFDYDVLNSLQIGGPAPEGAEFDGLRNGQAGAFVVDELAIWNKVLKPDEMTFVRDNEIGTLPVPEPSSSLLSCVAVVVCALRRRRA